MKRRPAWLKIRLRGQGHAGEVKNLLKNQNLHTVCQSARCPNIGECWSQKTATFMILGETCSRNCRFCAVPSGELLPPDPTEPERVARAVEHLKLKHAVITSVNRDDLPDGGSSYFIKTIKKIRMYSPDCSIEILIPDFRGDIPSLESVLKAKPDILNHNLEVVARLYPMARAQANFQTSLKILKRSKELALITKTGIMVGLGETVKELEKLFSDLADIGLDILTIGQYLQPSGQHLNVEKYYHPDEFKQLKESALQQGIKQVESGPLVRSSYHAREQKEQLRQVSRLS